MLKHGEYVAPEVKELGLEDSTPPKTNVHALHGSLERFNKRSFASVHPAMLGNVSAAYRDAMQVREAFANVQTRGAGILFTTIGIVPFLIFADGIGKGVVGAFSSFSMLNAYLVLGWLLLGYIVIFIFGPLLRAYFMIDLFAPEDLPIIFDRKHRKIYRLLMPLDGSAGRGLQRFGPIKLQAVEYDWDLVTAEHRVEVVGNGSTVSRIHLLMMVVRGV